MAHVTDNVFNIELTGDKMAIFGNFKGTTQSEFRIGKGATGTKLSSGVEPSSDVSTGDIYFDSANATIKLYDGSWKNLGATLTELNVDNGTLFVDNSNDTVSIGSTSSNEKLFVNGSLRLGTNPAIKYSGAYLDLKHSNGTGSVIRIRDNNTGTDPIFKVYDANNASEVFKVQGTTVRINDAYNLPIADGSANQYLKTDGAGNISFADVNVSPAGSNTAIQFNNSGSFGGTDALTFDQQTGTLQTGIVKGVLFDPIVDYGLVTENANITIDYGVVTETATNGDFEYVNDIYGPTGDSFAVANLPDASQPGQMIYVRDESGGATMAFSDGSNWRRIQDRVIVS